MRFVAGETAPGCSVESSLTPLHLQKGWMDFLFVPGQERAAHPQPPAPPSAVRAPTLYPGTATYLLTQNYFHMHHGHLCKAQHQSHDAHRGPGHLEGKYICRYLDTCFSGGASGIFFSPVSRGNPKSGIWGGERSTLEPRPGLLSFSELIWAAKLPAWLFPVIERASLASTMFQAVVGL